MFTVDTGVKGASRINSRHFTDEEEAFAAAERWARSNSTGDYWADVIGPDGKSIATYNLDRIAERIARLTKN